MPHDFFAGRLRATIMISAFAAAAATISTLYMSARPAHACSCAYDPDWGFVSGRDGRLPANAVGVVWFTPSEQDDESLAKRFTVEIREDGTFRPLQAKVAPVEGIHGMYTIGPEGEGLRVGATYRFTVDRVSRRVGAVGQVVVTVDHERLLASTALELEVGPVTRDSISVPADASCVAELDVSQVMIASRIDGYASRWREQLLFRTIIEEDTEWIALKTRCDSHVPGRSWEGTGQDRIFVACEDIRHHHIAKELEPGQYRLRMEALLPGTDVVLETPVKSVDLSCTQHSR